MAGGTLAAIQSGTNSGLFYWLKISGIPFMFFSCVDPTDTRKFGGSAWTLSSGYTAVPGMGLPDFSLTQTLPDILGGIASAESMKLTLIDFESYDANGPYNVLSRLFSPGIAMSTYGGYFELASDIPSNAGAGFAISLRSGTITPADGYYTVGSETLQLGTFGAPVNGVSTGSIVGARNRFPCASTFPVIPYHRVVRDETNGAAIGTNILVTPMANPFTMYGRTAAFYIGAMQPNGAPMPEADGFCRMIGRVKVQGYGDAGGMSASYELSISSIMDELDGALLAPGLAVAAIKPDQICLPTSPVPGGSWDPLMLSMFWGGSDKNMWRIAKPIAINSGIGGTFEMATIIDAVNAAIASLQGSTGAPIPACFPRPYCQIVERNGNDYVSFSSIGFRDPSGAGLSLSFAELQSGKAICINETPIMWALGFNRFPKNGCYTLDTFEDADFGAYGNGRYILIADNPVASVYIPTLPSSLAGNPSFAIHGETGSTNSTFFTDQGDGNAYVQLDAGAIIKLKGQNVDIAVTGRSLTTEGVFRYQDGMSPGAGDSQEAVFYYCPLNTQALVKQVVVAGDRKNPVDAGLMMGRFLASHDQASSGDDFNYYPEGVGLGWNQVMDKVSFGNIASLGTSYPREMIVDNASTLKDLIAPMLKEYGIGLVWNPATCLLTARPLRTPAAPGADVIILSASNRTTAADRTKTQDDPSNVRSSWTLDWGWDPWAKKFNGPETTLIDNIVQSTSQALHKNEKIEDKTLVVSSNINAIQFIKEMIYSRSYLYQQPWRRCTRSLNAIGLTLAPGSYHQIIDNTLANPFTGKIGVTAADGLYAIILAVTSNPQQPQKGQVVFLISRTGLSSFIRKWSPCGMVDYSAPNFGYDTATGILTMAKRYSSHAVNHDGWDFKVGDVGTLMSWSNYSGGIIYLQTPLTVSAVAADGSTITVPSGLPSVPTNVELIFMLENYSSVTATRQSTVAFQGSALTGQIGATTAQNVKWG